MTSNYGKKNHPSPIKFGPNKTREFETKLKLWRHFIIVCIRINNSTIRIHPLKLKGKEMLRCSDSELRASNSQVKQQTNQII